MTTRKSPYRLRLPVLLKAAVEQLSKRDGTSIKQFVMIAVAEKVAVITTEEIFARRAPSGGVPSHPELPGRRAAPPSRRELLFDLVDLGLSG